MRKKFRYVKEDRLLAFDEALMKATLGSLDRTLKILGDDWSWEDRTILPNYDRPGKTDWRGYITHSWSMPGRYAFLSIIKKRPNLAVLESLGRKVPNAWAWEQETHDHHQPSVWAGAAFIRDRRLRAGKALVEVLGQALEGAEDRQERARRAVAVLGGGWVYANQAQSHWGVMAWKSSSSWAKDQIDLLEIVGNWGGDEDKMPHIWQKWNHVCKSLAQDQDEERDWKEQTLAMAICSWHEYTHTHIPMISQAHWDLEDQDRLGNMDPRSKEAATLPEIICQALVGLGEGILKEERERGEVLLQEGNVKILEIITHQIMAQKPSQARAKFLNNLARPISYTQAYMGAKFGAVMGELSASARRELLMMEAGVDAQQNFTRSLRM